jgi:hypothetical protein
MHTKFSNLSNLRNLMIFKFALSEKFYSSELRQDAVIVLSCPKF